MECNKRLYHFSNNNFNLKITSKAFGSISKKQTPPEGGATL